MKASTLARRARKAQAAEPCWKCGVVGLPSQFGAAELHIDYADGSYSGVFRIHLCDDCLRKPHQDHSPLIPFNERLRLSDY